MPLFLAIVPQVTGLQGLHSSGYINVQQHIELLRKPPTQALLF